MISRWLPESARPEDALVERLREVAAQFGVLVAQRSRGSGRRVTTSRPWSDARTRQRLAEALVADDVRLTLLDSER
jgi:hypothetical protein